MDYASTERDPQPAKIERILAGGAIGGLVGMLIGPLGTLVCAVVGVGLAQYGSWRTDALNDVSIRGFPDPADRSAEPTASGPYPVLSKKS